MHFKLDIEVIGRRAEGNLVSVNVIKRGGKEEVWKRGSHASPIRVVVWQIKSVIFRMYRCINPDVMNLGRKKSLLVSWLVWFSPLLCFANQSHAYDQQCRDSIQYYLRKDNLAKYFHWTWKLAVSLADSARNDGSITDEEINAVFLVSDPLLKQFRNLNKKERLHFRVACMHVGNHLGRKLSRFKDGLDYLLKSHQFVEDDECLDSLSWYVENPICNYYIRLGDYDRALLFGLMVEKSLNHLNDFKNLSRLYANIGDIFYWKKDYQGATSYYSKGLELAIFQNNGLSISTNLYKLAAIQIDENQLLTAQELIEQAEIVLDSLNEQNIQDKKAALKGLKARIFRKENKLNEALCLYLESISYLIDHFKADERRELAKEYINVAEIYFLLDSTALSHEYLDKALSCLLPGYYDDNNLPLLEILYSDNSFIDLFKIKALVYKKEASEISNPIQKLERGIKCVNLAVSVNDKLRNSLIINPSKLLSIQANKELIDIGIQITYQLYSLTENSHYLVSARKLFNKSKSILFDEYLKKSHEFLNLNDNEQQKLMEIETIQDQLYNDYLNKKLDYKQYAVASVGLEESRKSIMTGKLNNGRKYLIAGDYLEYNIQEEDIFLFA